MLKYLCLISLTLTSLHAEEDGFVPLFNGKDLTGWVEVNTAPSTWSFNEEGYLVCSGKPIGEIRTERMYQNFIMEVEWRHLVPKGNAGLFVWADDITARGQPFIRGIEVQVLENAYGDTKSHTCHGDIFPIHGATMTPLNGNGRGMRTFPTEKRSNPSPQWNHYRVECRDGNISLAVNGKVVSQGKDCIPRKGYICIESEGGIVHYRNGRIKELPDTPINPEHIAIESRGFRCLYTGVDFAGWQKSAGWDSRDWQIRANPGATPLITEETFSGDSEIIFDLKLPEGSDSAEFEMFGQKFTIESGDPLLEKPGNWNRFEANYTNDQLVILLNEEKWKEASIPDGAGPLKLIPQAPSFWANPYARSL